MWADGLAAGAGAAHNALAAEMLQEGPQNALNAMKPEIRETGRAGAVTDG